MKYYTILVALLLIMPVGASLGAEAETDDGLAESLTAAQKVFFVRYSHGGKRVSNRSFVILPAKRPEGEATPIPWVWYAPMLRDDRGRQMYPNQWHNWLFEKLIEAGFAVVGTDVGESWGNPDGRVGFTHFYQHVVKEFGLAPKANFLAEGRGMLMVLNWAVENPDKVQAIGAIYPACRISPSMFFGRVYRLTGTMDDKANEAALAEQFKQHNPLDRLAPLAEAKVPMLLLHGIEDKVVPPIDHSGELALRYRKLGGTARFILKRNERHEPSDMFFKAPELLRFFVKQLPPVEADAPAPDNKAPDDKTEAN